MTLRIAFRKKKNVDEVRELLRWQVKKPRGHGIVQHPSGTLRLKEDRASVDPIDYEKLMQKLRAYRGTDEQAQEVG